LIITLLANKYAIYIPVGITSSMKYSFLIFEIPINCL
jgi:hypothetical protein